MENRHGLCYYYINNMSCDQDSIRLCDKKEKFTYGEESIVSDQYALGSRVV